MTIRARERLRLAALMLAVSLTLIAAQLSAAVVRTAVVYRPHPVARAAVATTAVVATAAVVGSVARSLPPSCSSVVAGGVAYQQCGNTWYQPQYAGSQVSYVVVNPPR